MDSNRRRGGARELQVGSVRVASRVTRAGDDLGPDL